MKRLAFVLPIAALGSICAAQSFSSGKLQLRASRDGMEGSGMALVTFFGDANREMARVNMRFTRGIAPGRLESASFRLPTPLDYRQVRRIQIQPSPRSGDTLSVAGTHLLLGDTFPRVLMVSEITTGWNSGARDFTPSPQTEAALKLTNIRFTGQTTDGARPGTFMQALATFADGRTVAAQDFDPMSDNKPFTLTFPCNPPIRRAELRQLHLIPIDTHRGGPTTNLSPDDIHMGNLEVMGTLESGLDIQLAGFRPVTLNDYASWKSPDLSPGSANYANEERQSWFKAIVWTGNDDLRWAVDQQPNMEIQINITLRGSRAPIILFSRALEPYAAFASDTPGAVFLGSFGGHKSAQRIMRWLDSGRPPRLQDIQSIEVRAVPGWDGSTPTRRVARGTSLFSPDKWQLKGLWLGSSVSLPPSAPGANAQYAGWSTLFADGAINRDLTVGQAYQANVNIGTPSVFLNSDIFRNLNLPRPLIERN